MGREGGEWAEEEGGMGTGGREARPDDLFVSAQPRVPGRGEMQRAGWRLVEQRSCGPLRSLVDPALHNRQVSEPGRRDFREWRECRDFAPALRGGVTVSWG